MRYVARGACRRWRAISLLGLLGVVLCQAISGPMNGTASAAGRPDADLPDRANEALGLYASTVATAAIHHAADGTVTASVSLGGRPHTLDLKPHTVRAVGYRLRVQGADGTFNDVAPGDARTYRGSVVGIAGSAVAASVEDDGLHARIMLPGGSEYWIEPVAAKVQGAPQGAHVSYRTEDIIPNMSKCEADDALRPLARSAVTTMEATAACGTGMCVAELAVDADFEYYQIWGSVTGVENRINAVVNAVNLQYERDVQLRHVVTTILVRAAEPDPYTSTSAITLLNQFRNEWTANHGSIPRDMAELFTGKNIDGGTIGIAWVGVVCGSYAYSVVESSFTTNFGAVTDLTSHELGHNWNAGHCDCAGDPSYTMNPFITASNLFNPTSTIPSIQSYRDSRSCLTAGSACQSDADCDDGQYCSGSESCSAGLCESAGNPCVAQFCDEAGDACVDCLSDVDCDDGTFCNGAEACNAGLCDSGADPCVGLFCNEASAACADCLAASDCDDSVFCNGSEDCVNDVCQAGSDPCPGQICDELGATCTDCMTTADCDDGAFCNGAEDCVGGLCQSDGDPCPGEDCDELLDVCVPILCNNDGVCEGVEDCNNCPADCATGNGAVCGNGVCETAAGEDCLTCSSDCNGKQNGKPSRRFCCGDGGTNPVACKDSRCTNSGYACSDATPALSCCGDGVCEGNEDSCDCETDCGAPSASENICDDGVDNDCDGATDCGDGDCTADSVCQFTSSCGNGVCEPGENCASCRGDCKAKTGGKAASQYCCGNGVTEGPEASNPDLCDGNN